MNEWNKKEFYEFQMLVSEESIPGERFIELRNRYSTLDHNLAKVIAKGASTSIANVNSGCIFRSQFKYDGIGYTTKIVPNPKYDKETNDYVGSYTDYDIRLMTQFLGKHFPNIQYRMEKKKGYIELTLM